jgi:succinate-acetate transporter protein
MGTLAAAEDNVALTATLLFLAAGSTLLAIALLGGFPVVQAIAGYILILSALLAWYIASAMMVQATYKRFALPIGKRYAQAERAITGRTNPIQYAAGEPAIKIG